MSFAVIRCSSTEDNVSLWHHAACVCVSVINTFSTSEST